MNFFDSLGHYFFPRRSNNHRAKILHVSSLLIISLFFLTFQIILNYLPSKGIKVMGYAANISTSEVVQLTNQKRTEAGIPALKYSSLLSQAALAKGNHMLANGYWAHIAPDGTEPWKFFTDVGYKYRYAGENLARDFTNPGSVIDAWMASPTHRDNLLSTKYVDIGVAVVEGSLGGTDTTIIVQLFGSPLGESQPVVAKAKTPTNTPTPVIQADETASPSSDVAILSLTPSPVPTTTPTPVFSGTLGNLDSPPPSESKASTFEVLLSPFQTTRGISILITSVLIIVFIIDLIVVTRRRLPRSSSRTLAHIAFLGMILTIAILAKVGKIL